MYQSEVNLVTIAGKATMENIYIAILRDPHMLGQRTRAIVVSISSSVLMRFNHEDRKFGSYSSNS